MSETVLITGGSGFIGTYLTLALLERGDRVVNFDVRPASGPMAWLLGERLEAVRYVEGTVEDWPSLIAACHEHGVTQIAHLASPIDTAYLNRHPKVALDVMIAGTVNVLETIRTLGLGRLLFFSSIGVLPARQYEPIDCNHPVILAAEGPGSGAYGAAKVAGEALCFAYQKSYGLDFVAIRPSAVYGFLTHNLIYLPQFIDGALRGEPVHFTHGGAVPRDYTHVADIAGIAAAALAAPAPRLRHRVFYAASGQPLVTAAETADLVRSLIPGADLSIDLAHDEYDELELPFRGLLDVRPVEEQLGYTIRYTDLRAGIAENIAAHGAWLRSQGITPAPAAVV